MDLKEISVFPHSLKHHSQEPKYENNLSVIDKWQIPSTLWFKHPRLLWVHQTWSALFCHKVGKHTISYLWNTPSNSNFFLVSPIHSLDLSSRVTSSEMPSLYPQINIDSSVMYTHRMNVNEWMFHLRMEYSMK